MAAKRFTRTGYIPSSAVYIAPAGGVGSVQLVTGDIGLAVNLGNVSGAINLSSYTLASQTFRLTATGNLTLAPAGMPLVPDTKSGSFSLRVTQDGTGSRTLTLDSAIKAPYGNDPVLSTAAASQDLIHFFWDGVQWNAMLGGAAMA